MAKKRLKKKKIQIDSRLVILIIIILIIVVGIWGVYNHQKENASINEVNKFFYDSLLCISNCPSVILLGTNPLQTIFDENCTDGCRLGAEDVGKKLMGIALNDSRIIVNSQEFSICKNNFNAEGSAEKYKACLKEILPTLKERFRISN